MPLVRMVVILLILFPLVFTAAAVEIPIDVMVYVETMEGPRGGLVTSVVGVEPGGSGQVRVGFFEGVSAGSGPMWRSSGWMAAVVSSYLLGLDLADYSVYFDFSGRIDGPSAGGLMTVALLAALLDHTLDPQVTMTGTINPDGSIGPVGGIAYKLEGAAGAGKTRVLIPVGKRFELVREGSIDLLELGRDLGIEVLEVGDIFEAYYYLTGKDLYRPTVSPHQRFTLPLEVDSRMKEILGKWETDILHILASVPQEGNQEGYAMVEIELGRAQQAFFQGLMGTAYMHLGSAAVMSQALLIQQEIFSFLEEIGWGNTAVYLQEKFQGIAAIQTFLQDLKKLEPSTLEDVIVFSEGYALAIQAFGSYILGDMAKNEAILFVEKLQELEYPGEEIQMDTFFSIYESALFFHVGDLLLEMAREYLEIGLGFGQLPPPKPAAVENLARMLYTAAEASMEYMDRSVLDELARESGIHLEEFRWSLMANDYFYSLTYANYLALKILGDDLSAYGLLGGSSALFYDMASNIVKYYSLDAQICPVGSMENIGNTRALRHMLKLAEELARENIMEVLEMGATPVISLLMLEAGQGVGPRDWDEELDALYLLWKAGFQARTLLFLSRNLQDEMPQRSLTVPLQKTGERVSRSGVLGPRDEMFQDHTYYQVYRITPSQGGRLTITLQSSQFQPYLLFLDQEGTILGERGSSSPGEVYLEFEDLIAATYLVVVNTVTAGEEGAYTLQLEYGTFD